jgi:CHAD domain-containing protein
MVALKCHTFIRGLAGHDKKLSQTTYTDPMTHDLHDSISTVLPQLGTVLLDEAKMQGERLGDEDSEALHDFRVSVRRLRSFLKSYESFIKGAKKHRQRFSEVMNLTNAGRDNEVHLVWLKEHQKDANNLEKDGMDYLLENLSSTNHLDLDEVKKQFTKAAEKLESAFSKDVKNIDESFATLTADVLQTYGKDLQTLLASVDKSEDDTAIHDARIAGKKLRYTLELLENKEAKALVKLLKKFQDTAGNLHDLQVLEPKVQTFLFAETVLWSQAFRDGSKTLSHSELNQLPELQRSYGLAAVQRRLESEKTLLFQTLQKHWLSENGQDFFSDLGAFIETLGATNKESSKPAKTPVKKSKKSTKV